MTPQYINTDSDTSSIMEQPLTPQEEEQLRTLRRRKAKQIRDQNRQRKYSPRSRYQEAQNTAKES